MNQKGKKKTKKVRPTKVSKSAEVKYRRQLTALTGRLRKDIATNIVPLLKQLEPQYVNDGYALTLEEAFDNLRKNYRDINENAKIVANSFVEGTNNTNKTRFYKAMEEAVGVNVSNIIQNEGLEDILVATTRENVGLIRSIPEEYFKKIETVVFSNVTQGTKANSTIKQIQKIGKTTANRAKLIARDQSSKLNSALNQQRQQNLGVDEYIWRTAGDDRERKNHHVLNGMLCKWSDQTVYSDNNGKTWKKRTSINGYVGNPGQDIQCRCVGQAVIEF